MTNSVSNTANRSTSTWCIMCTMRKQYVQRKCFRRISFQECSLSCGHRCHHIKDNIRYFLVNRFFRRKWVENTPCDSLPLVNLSMTNLSLFLSSTVDIISNSINQSALKLVALSSCGLHNFLNT